MPLAHGAVWDPWRSEAAGDREGDKNNHHSRFFYTAYLAHVGSVASHLESTKNHIPKQRRALGTDFLSYTTGGTWSE